VLGVIALGFCTNYEGTLASSPPVREIPLGWQSPLGL